MSTVTPIREIKVVQSVADQVVALPTNSVVIVRNTVGAVVEVLVRTGRTGWVRTYRQRLMGYLTDTEVRYLTNTEVRDLLSAWSMYTFEVVSS